MGGNVRERPCNLRNPLSQGPCNLRNAPHTTACSIRNGIGLLLDGTRKSWRG
jgi:hypothetical protein